MAKMTAVRYLKEKARMSRRCELDCSKCPLGSYRNRHGVSCPVLESKHPEAAVEIVESWAKTNQIKSMLQDLLEKFPDTEMWSENVPVMCPCHMGYEKRPDFCTKIRTAEQCEYCWSRPMEEKR